MTDAMETTAPDVQQTRLRLTPHYARHSTVRSYLRTVTRVPVTEALVESMYAHLWDQRGTPQATMDWTDPERWIPERLNDPDEIALAQRLWRESNHTVNPRYVNGRHLFAMRHELLRPAPDGALILTERGGEFVREADGRVVAETDSQEAVLVLLQIVAERGMGRRADFFGAFLDYCRTATTWDSESLTKHAMLSRMSDLVERGLLAHSGISYQITDAGLRYLDRFASLVPRPAGQPTGRRAQLWKLVHEISEDSRQALADHLAAMDPYRFETLVRLLLEEMNYTNVRVTAPANDKGVDVVADIQMGITSVREVVQVKRHKGNIGRPVLDQLRGSLHRFDALQGTIITTGGFSKGTAEAAFERGAAPITLIDGDRLLDLLTEHEIGIRKQTVEYFEFDPARLMAVEDATGEPE